MIFYDCSTAPSPRRARMFLAEKGLNVETRDISIRDGDQLQPGFLAVNPRATVPVLVTDAGTVLTENIAIATYLEELVPEPPLIGRGPDQRGLVMMWNAIAEQQGLLPMSEALRNSNPFMKGRAVTGQANIEQIPELAERGRTRFALFLDMLEARLRESDHVALDTFSLADITAYVVIDYSRVIKMAIPETNTATRAWFDRIAARPSAKL
jgi:glutathione S-transferase